MSYPNRPTYAPLVAQQDLGNTSKVVIVLGVALGLTFGFGPMFFSVVGVFLKAMTVSFQWSRADVALLPMLAMVGTAIGAPIAGYAADRIGWGKVIGYSIVLFAASLLALALAPANHAYVGIVGFLIGVTGASTTAAGYLAVLPSVFEARLGMALGFGMIGTGIGGYAAPIAANYLTTVTDWRHSYEIFAALALGLGLIAHQIIFRTLADRQRERKAMNALVDAQSGMTLREALANYRFWLLGVVVFLVSSSVLGGFVHLPAFASDTGLGRDVAARSAALVGVGLAVSRVGVGFVLDRVFAPLVGLIAFFLGAVAFAILLSGLAHDPAYILLAAFLLGISTGTEGDIIPYLTRKYFGKRAFGVIYGALFGCATVGAAVGPFIYGLAFDHFKSYGPIHQASALICVVSALAVVLLGKYPATLPASKEA
ncbi:MFS transporter [Cupriavidus sp. IDO]|uniref:MFS transporter n=1 Tax=Cupriavidus sp. IDO TaxID=1539142 RepID=UPI00068F8F6D|nr:MFS transporter [Cupriavidus sp. IDO]KWR87815.1 hypothetical protein RM96_22730 [Cupriavidus sp. IDO]